MKKKFIPQNAFQNIICEMVAILSRGGWVSTMRPRQNGRHFANDIFKYIFLNENFWIVYNISLKHVPWGPVDNMAALVQIMAWRQIDNKPLSGAMLYWCLYALLGLNELKGPLSYCNIDSSQPHVSGTSTTRVRMPSVWQYRHSCICHLANKTQIYICILYFIGVFNYWLVYVEWYC